MKKLLLLLAFLLVAGQAQAAYYTGKKLMEWCQTEASIEQGMCRGYIAGVSEANHIFPDVTVAQKMWCVPGLVALSELRLITLKYMETHPGDLHMAASALVAGALLEAFPCE